MVKPRLWRVDVVHIRGYHAPCSLIETQSDREHEAEAEALETAKKNCRLSDFDCWEFIPTNLRKKQLNGKWYSQDEFNRLIGRSINPPI